MFIELITVKNETVTININLIITIMPNKKGTLVEDVYGNIYEFPISYYEFVNKVNENNKVIKNV